MTEWQVPLEHPRSLLYYFVREQIASFNAIHQIKYLSGKCVHVLSCYWHEYLPFMAVCVLTAEALLYGRTNIGEISHNIQIY